MVKIKKTDVKTHKTVKKTTRKIERNQEDYSRMTVDDFLNQGFEENNSDSEEVDTKVEQWSSEPDENDSEAEEDEIASHKIALSKLQHTDPEFYQFLQENDKKLLQFNVEESDEESGAHVPPAELDVASDDSDFEENGHIRDGGTVTLKILKTWETQIQTDTSNKTIVALIQAFHAALLTVTSEGEEQSEYKVEGSAAFNGVIQLCVLHLGPALRRFLRITSKQPPHKCKKFNKIKGSLKDYFADLSKLLNGVTSSNIQTVLLKHLHYMSPFMVSYPHVTKTILKRLISLWGTGSDGVRVICFFCILRIANSQKPKFLETVIKAMYMTYVKNSKFVSVGSLAGINFMRRSLVEMFALDADVAYRHVFLYIRQLAINLRNAITVSKKENIQAVYNWQYVNSLKLWGNLLSVTTGKAVLQQLVYPFVQVCLGVLKLLPTAQYYPLRFHVVQILVDLSRDTGVFIPVIPFVLEVLSYDFNKKHQRVSMKPLQFTFILRASKSQMTENGFKDALIDCIYSQLIEYLASYSNSIAFPDLSLVCRMQIKQFLKKCSNANYKRKMKQLLDKIEQNGQFIENERSKVTLNITYFKQIEGWEAQIMANGTPLRSFFEEWNKLHTIKKNKELTNNADLGDYKLPSVTKKTKARSEGPVELFPSDSEEEDIPEKRKRGKRGNKNAIKKVKDENWAVEDGGEADIVEDLKMSDW